MSWVHVARKDFEDAGRSLLLWALTVILLLLVAGLSAIPSLLAEGSTPPYEEALMFLFTPIGFLVPIIGLIVGYQAIVGERESGSMRFLLGLPNSRRDVVLGKVVGRAGVVAVPTIIAFLAGAVVVAALYDGFDVVNYVGLMAFSLVMGLVYVAIAVGVSASVSSRAKAVAGAAGVFVVFDIIWQFVPMAIYWFLEGELPNFFENVPVWYVFLERLSPSESLSAISLTLVDFFGAEDIDLTAAGRVGGEIPFYLENWFAWLIILAWIVVPLAVGYARFSRATLN